jgi:superfamily II DNA helicase RecQ
VNLPLDLRPDARETLKRVFGHDDFRHAQRAVIDDVMAGHDTFVLLPTGSGKSLCYQLPALLTPGLTVVVSPLIALMKNQVDALHAAGVEATFLNSSLEPAEASRRLAGLRQGRFRLLYVAPERLLLDGFLRELGQWNVARFAVDEAHCISEWGHDFRPEYRRLVEVRDLFPGVPVVALTATANERVRADILQGLRMREPLPRARQRPHASRDRRVREATAGRERHRVRAEPGRGRTRRRRLARRGHRCFALSRRPRCGHARPPPGTLRTRRRAGHLRHDRLRDGHR